MPKDVYGWFWKPITSLERNSEFVHNQDGGECFVCQHGHFRRNLAVVSIAHCTSFVCKIGPFSILDHMITDVVLLKKPIQEGATIDRVKNIELIVIVCC